MESILREPIVSSCDGALDQEPQVCSVGVRELTDTVIVTLIGRALVIEIVSWGGCIRVTGSAQTQNVPRKDTAACVARESKVVSGDLTSQYQNPEWKGQWLLACVLYPLTEIAYRHPLNLSYRHVGLKASPPSGVRAAGKPHLGLSAPTWLIIPSQVSFAVPVLP